MYRYTKLSFNTAYLTLQCLINSQIDGFLKRIIILNADWSIRHKNITKHVTLLHKPATCWHQPEKQFFSRQRNLNVICLFLKDSYLSFGVCYALCQDNTQLKQIISRVEFRSLKDNGKSDKNLYWRPFFGIVSYFL